MGRKEQKRISLNAEVRELLQKEVLNKENIRYIKQFYSGIGGLIPNQWAKGQFFSPPVVTKFITDFLGIEEGSRILEPSCGSGAFFEYLPSACELYGIEWMEETSKVASLCYPHATIIQGDALKTGWDQPFDYVIGNPPYSLPVKDWKFQCGKALKSEVAFIIYALQNLRVGGKMAFIVPDSLLGNKNDLPFRSWLLEHHRIIGVISLPKETFYHVGTQTKTSILVVEKLEFKNPMDDYMVFMAICEDIGWDSRGRETGKCDLPEILEAYNKHKGKNGDNEEVGTECSEPSSALPISYSVEDNGQLALF